MNGLVLKVLANGGWRTCGLLSTFIMGTLSLFIILAIWQTNEWRIKQSGPVLPSPLSTSPPLIKFLSFLQSNAADVLRFIQPPSKFS